MEITDPDDLALLLVQQYLQERGYAEALKALERTCGLKYVDSKLPQGSMLMELVYGHMERQAAGAEPNPELEAAEAEEEELKKGGAGDYPASIGPSLDGVHTANIISIACCPGTQHLITGEGNGVIQRVDFDRTVHWQWHGSHGGILSLALHPASRRGDCRLLAGTMDGSVLLLDARSGDVLHSERVHSKYVVRVRWAGNGDRFVSASWDCTVAVFVCRGDGFEVLRREEYPSAVQDVEVLRDGATAVVALRESNLLRLYDVRELKEKERVNMNELVDSHVSFSVSHLALSPDGKYLLACTDTERIIMFRVRGWGRVRIFYDLVQQKFHQPSAAWHASGHYIFVAVAGGQVYVFHVGSAKVVAKLRPHAGSVTRCLGYDADENALYTGGFDKTIKRVVRDTGSHIG